MFRFTILIAIALFTLACGVGPDMTKDRIPPPPSPTPFVPDKPIGDYLRDGAAAYAAGNFFESVVHYKKAFEIEQREQKLEKKERLSAQSEEPTVIASVTRAGEYCSAK